MNQDFYNSLTQEQREIIDEAAEEFVKAQRQMELEDTDHYIELLEEEGMQVNSLTAEQKADFRQVLEPMYEKYRVQYGEEVFEMAEKYEE